MRLRRFLSGVVPVLALAAGCAEAGGPFAGAEQAVPVAPRLNIEATAGVQRVASYKQAKAKPANLWVKAWIGPAGGSVDYYGFRIVVPAGAVSKVTMFTITLPKDGTVRAVAEFGPHNVTFAQPVTIELPYVGTTAEGYPAKALWYDPSASAWVDVGGALTADGQRVSATVTHFSEYATKETKDTDVEMFGGSTSTSGG